eukprot:CAMPEP_0114559116 /NCGR_PEP_ID=MMETSP0114-20121206/10751_1 /TAXON_ID=31324 /ORGANISM="Goniomonas sp, Strain m" /LENGTH=152 /DNA_ID=CAMNT_0001744567 /DNA_START=81 /DNA_END=539 /DNA_ORIENTATION=+
MALPAHYIGDELRAAGNFLGGLVDADVGEVEAHRKNFTGDETNDLNEPVNDFLERKQRGNELDQLKERLVVEASLVPLNKKVVKSHVTDSDLKAQSEVGGNVEHSKAGLAKNTDILAFRSPNESLVVIFNSGNVHGVVNRGGVMMSSNLSVN